LRGSVCLCSHRRPIRIDPETSRSKPQAPSSAERCANSSTQLARNPEAACGPDHPNVAIRVSNLGSRLRELGDLDGARDHFERALRIDEAAYGPRHSRTRNVAADLAWLQDRQ
jgi:Tfp pilus assembly protein PilF